MKRLAIVLGSLSLISYGVFYYIYMNLGSIIERGIENYGSKILNVPVEVAKVDIEVKEGLGIIHNLTIGNPAGSSAKHALTLDQVKFQLDINTIQDNTIVIKEISIDQPAITYEMAARGPSNFQKIKSNVDRYGGRGDSSSENQRKLIIDHFYVRNSQVNISSNVPFLKGRAMTRNLPTIHIKDIGRSQNGATPKQAAKIVMREVQKKIGPLSKGLDPNQLRGLAASQLNKAKNQAKEEAKSAIQNANPLKGKKFGL